jgi:ubiquinone/menaquinone biosynthesis C-methylase UbiE
VENRFQSLPFKCDLQRYSTGLNEIPFPDRHFDLVWSSEVFEHVPTHLINQSVAEVVRVAKKHMFFSIAMKRSGFDPDPPAVGLCTLNQVDP